MKIFKLYHVAMMGTLLCASSLSLTSRLYAADAAEQERLESYRIEEKILEQKREDKRQEEYRQDKARIERKLYDERWNRAHGR